MVQLPPEAGEFHRAEHRAPKGPVFHQAVPIRVPGSDKGPFKAERILLEATYPTQTEFQDDLRAQGDAFVGFHVFGKCPSCGHYANALLATKYLTYYDSDGSKTKAPAPASLNLTKRLETLSLTRIPTLAHPRAQPNAAPPNTPFPADDTRRTQVLVMRCNCDQNHSDKGDAFGCGSEWLLAVNYIPNDSAATVYKLPLSGADSSRVWQSAESVTAATSATLTSSQASATKWTSVFTAALGVLGLAGILGGRTTIQTLGGGWEFGLGLAVVVALLGNIAMLALANNASLGFPTLRKAPDKAELQNADLQPLRDADAAIKALDKARTAAYLSGFAALIAIFIFIFAPQPAATGDFMLKIALPQTPASATSTTTVSTVTQCGSLAISADGKTYTLTPARGGTAVTYPVVDITQIEKC
jgi:hypothetical protein